MGDKFFLYWPNIGYGQFVCFVANIYGIYKYGQQRANKNDPRLNPWLHKNERYNANIANIKCTSDHIVVDAGGSLYSSSRLRLIVVIILYLYIF